VTSPVTRYARSGDVNIAYQVIDGEGPLDVVSVHGFVGNMEVQAEQPGHEVWFERLASLGRVIRFDRRGTGLSDRVREVPTIEARMDDLCAVMDAASSRRAAIVSTFEAASLAMVYAATYPERVAALALYNPVAKGVRSSDYPWANSSEEDWEKWLGQIHTSWGTLEYAAEFSGRSRPALRTTLRWWSGWRGFTGWARAQAQPR
jgi:pimeloyl-ACP methyl ester carboxylesterase